MLSYWLGNIPLFLYNVVVGRNKVDIDFTFA